MPGMMDKSRFHHSEGLDKPVPACLTGTKDRESNFNHSEVAVNLVQACLSGRKD